jgi:hypothetical protein
MTHEGVLTTQLLYRKAGCSCQGPFIQYTAYFALKTAEFITEQAQTTSIEHTKFFESLSSSFLCTVQ